MDSVRGARVWLTSVLLIMLGLALAVLASPAASAGLREDPARGEIVASSSAASSSAGASSTTASVTSVPPGSPAPRMLASTGLDITVPVVVGLGILVLGTVMVGWAFLATGRRAPTPSGRHR